ncbi:MAG: hypothetical protein U1F43_31025 [Myxococcota bacterium]
MQKTDWSVPSREVIAPLLESGEDILAMGVVEFEAINTGDRLFNGLPRSKYATRTAEVVFTTERVMFVRNAYTGDASHTAVSAAPWGALKEVVNPKPFISGQLRFLNFIFPSGVNRFGAGDGAVKTEFFGSLAGPMKMTSSDPDGRQKAFYENAVAIAKERVEAAHAAGQAPSGELLTTVALVSTPTPKRERKQPAASGAATPKAPGKGRWLPILLWVLAAGALGFGTFCFLHLRDEQSYLAHAPEMDVASVTQKVKTLTLLSIASASAALSFIVGGIALWRRGSRRGARAVTALETAA